jgi:tetratricopeptide (TPR) repeat protein
MVAKRRIDVMLSSTFSDLVRHREAVIAAMTGLQLTPLAQEFDAALSDSDLIKASLDKVDKADAYVGLIGSRYGQRPVCPVRNPEQLSLTELEFRRAVERGLSRCTFIMGADHTLTRGDLDRSMAEGVDSHNKRDAFIKVAKKERITAEFTSPDDLKAKATTSFVALQKVFELKDAEGAADTPPSPDDNLPVAPPAFHYVRKPYVEKQGFAGRAAELALIDRWATGSDAMLLFQAIGGMGKSMLTWHWLRTRAAGVRGDWAGRLWYSFYEQGADLNGFCVQALAYIRHEPPKTFRGRRTLDLGDELRRELDARPWLLILDGLERVLVAYNRAGKEHMTDEEAVVARDGMGLDREPRSCFRPEDDDVLGMLAQASSSKLLASSRLTPTALTNATRQPIPGVTRVALEGLAQEDAEQVLRNASVRGDGWRIRHFLDDKFRCHPLSVGAVAGQVATFQEARYDFDRWVEHPKGGADPALIAKDLRGRQNHILAQAFGDLDDDAKALLGSIAMASIELAPDVLRILNAKRPIEPAKVDPPCERGETWDFESRQLRRERESAETDEARAVAQEKLDAHRKQDFTKQKERYESYVAAHPAWQQKAGEADAWLAQALPDLEARGLLQYDADAGSLDMHPAIRHTALIGLSPEARSSTGSHVSDALSSRPVKPFEEARTREDLALVMTRVEALNAAGKFKDGWSLLSDGLDGALYRLQYGHEYLELMHPYFPRGWEQGPILLPEDQHSDALDSAASSLRVVGKSQLATMLHTRAIKSRLADEEVNLKGVINGLGNLANSVDDEGQRARGERILSLAIRMAEADGDEDDVIWLRANQANDHINRGRLGEAEAILIPFRDVVADKQLRPIRETQILVFDLYLSFRAGSFNESIAEQRLKRVRSLVERLGEIRILSMVARWRQAQSKYQGALDAFEDLISLANEAGSQHLPDYEAHRAVSLAALGRQEEARRVTAKVNHGKDPPHVPLALLHLELGDQVKARTHALAGYKEAWGEGPPYHDHWLLEDCRKVLAAVGEPEPVLPPFDPSKVPPNRRRHRSWSAGSSGPPEQVRGQASPRMTTRAVFWRRNTIASWLGLGGRRRAGPFPRPPWLSRRVSSLSGARRRPRSRRGDKPDHDNSGPNLLVATSALRSRHP